MQNVTDVLAFCSAGDLRKELLLNLSMRRCEIFAMSQRFPQHAFLTNTSNSRELTSCLEGQVMQEPSAPVPF